jgi:hypothetical protein
MADMKQIPLRMRSVGDLAQAKEHFYIPSYQRGYRWDAEQVKALLDDLKEFEKESEGENTPGAFYCLQPLVVVKGEKVGQQVEWEVVDGQQRLTTLFLILKRLLPAEHPLFHIRYERHPENKLGLAGLLQELSKDHAVGDSSSPDFYYIQKAEQVIQDWIKDHAGSMLPSLTRREGLCAKFIWQQIDKRGPHEAIRTFTRLNAGKIRLKDSELIRALFLRTDALDEGERLHLALRWDQMERRLQNPEFWGFLTNEKEPPESRIEFLFRLYAEEKIGKVNKDRVIFKYFVDQLECNTNRKALWQEVEDLFLTLEEWFEDNQLFHLIGFLVAQGKIITDLRAEATKSGKTAFVRTLKKLVREDVLTKVTPRGEIENYLAKLEYGESNSMIKKVLLCLNLATLDADQTDTVRFSFHAYKKEENGWDIEHIRATESRGPEGEKELRAVLRAMKDYVQRKGKESDGDYIALFQLDLENPVNKDDLKKLYARLLNKMEGSKELEPSDRLENLTLLDAGTNRGYGNSPFQVKRDWILGLDRQSKYLLPCTRNVFSKSYSKSPINLLHWTPDDAQDYLSAITDTLTVFFDKTWEEPQ